MARRPLLLIFTFAAGSTAALACGSRTGLLVPIEDASPPGEDVFQPDAGEEPGPPEAGEDVTIDVREEDAREEDAIPPLDVSPPLDVQSECPDAGSTFVYVITEQNVLLSFYPPAASFKTIGTISCPDRTTPFSMAVDRTGLAYVEFSSGRLYKVSTLTAACTPTPFQPGQSGFNTFGMGFSQDTTDTGETLFVAGDTTPARLGTIDVSSFRLTPVGTFSPPIGSPELTGTGAGDLFAFYDTGSNASAIGQIDKTTARVIGQAVLQGVPQGQGWAFAFWGGDFYTFTAPPTTGHTLVNRYRPSDGSVTLVAQTPGLIIVGAGVSTCAPQQ